MTGCSAAGIKRFIVALSALVVRKFFTIFSKLRLHDAGIDSNGDVCVCVCVCVEFLSSCQSPPQPPVPKMSNKYECLRARVCVRAREITCLSSFLCKIINPRCAYCLSNHEWSGQELCGTLPSDLGTQVKHWTTLCVLRVIWEGLVVGRVNLHAYLDIIIIRVQDA